MIRLSIQLLHTADIHLGHRQYGIVEREKDVYEVFNEIIDLALREHVDLVIFAGDLFDTPKPPPQALLVAIRGIQRLSERGIKPIAILGDHDLPRRRMLPALVLLKEVTPLILLSDTITNSEHRILVKGEELQLVGLDAHNITQSLALKTKLSQVKPRARYSILILHQSLREVVPYGEISLADLPRGFKYYALGHVHKTTVLTFNNTYVAYPGSPEALKLDEVKSQDSRYVIFAELTRESTSIERIKLLKPRPQLYIEITSSDIEEKVRKLLHLVSLIKKEKKPLVHIGVKGIRERKHLYSLLDRTLSKHVLYYRILTLDTEVNTVKTSSLLQTMLQIESTTKIRLEDVLSSIFGNYTSYVMKIIEVLSTDPQKHAILEAIEVTNKLYKDLLEGDKK